jgi:alpha-1,6-mannosyltransferase
VARRRRIPAVAFFHSHLPRLVGSRCGALLGRVASSYLSALYERFDAVFAPSQIMCDYLRSLGLRRVLPQPLGVDTTIFHPQRRHEDLRAQLGLPPQVRLLAFAGRFSGEKNIHVLHDAFARLGPGYHLLLVGGGEERRPAANITVLPYRRDSAELAGILASVDALVHAGTAETFGLVVLEAMACGRPVVGVRAAAVAELVDDTVGVAAPRATGALMANAVRDLYDRDLEALGRAARARVEARYSWDIALRGQLAVYASLSAKKRILPEGWATASLRPSADQAAVPAGPSSSWISSAARLPGPGRHSVTRQSRPVDTSSAPFD